MDQLASMRAFVRVVQTGGFSRAARRLEISPAMVTKHVGMLEERLGLRLLQRTTRQVTLTDVGSAYYEHCVRVLAEIDDTEASLAALTTEAAGRLRISAGLGLGDELAALLVAFTRAHPGIEPELVLENRFVDLVEERYDVAVRAAISLRESSLVARPLARSRFLLCASPAYLAASGTPRAPEELEAHRFLALLHPLLRTGIALRRGRDKRIVRIGAAMRSNSEDALRVACIAGAGILLLASYHAAREVSAGRLVPVLEDWSIGHIGVHAMYPHRRHLPAKVRAFVDFLAAELGGDGTRDPWWERVRGASNPL